MKLLSKILVLFFLFLGNCVGAEPFKVLVLPVDLFTICENYYCFPEASEVFAKDVISNFNQQKRISSPDLYDVRKKITENPQLKSAATTALNKYKNSNYIDFISLKKLSDEFKANSILMISSSIIEKNTKRNVWEVLEVSSAFDTYKLYSLETNAVLTDNVNDIVMWSGKYKRSLGNNESRFWAKSTANANSQLEKIRLYSRDIISKNITQNITLRFYPKTIQSAVPKSTTTTKSTDFRPNTFGTINSTRLQDDNDYGEIHTDTIFNF